MLVFVPVVSAGLFGDFFVKINGDAIRDKFLDFFDDGGDDKPVFVCSDSDGGSFPFVYGVVTDKKGVKHNDYCSGSSVVEGKCSFFGSYSSSKIDCSGGCSGGRCLKVIEKPECFSDVDCDDGNLCTHEGYASGKCQTIATMCPVGEQCNRDTGACEVVNYCRDRDGGYVPFVFGTVVDNEGEYDDYCLDLDMLVEGICSSNFYSSSEIDCVGVCEGGVCLKVIEKPIDLVKRRAL